MLRSKGPLNVVTFATKSGDLEGLVEENGEFKVTFVRIVLEGRVMNKNGIKMITTNSKKNKPISSLYCEIRRPIGHVWPR